MAISFYVKAIWDAEASVWTSDSNIPGLVLETSTLSEFESLAKEFAPHLLAENLGIHGEIPVKFEAVGGFDVIAA